MPEKVSLRIYEDHRSEFPHLTELVLPPVLREAYGSGLEFVADPNVLKTPLVFGNFVVSKEGIYNLRKTPGGAPISQGNKADAYVMALLRASADAVMVGAGTLNGEPSHEWSAGFIFDRFGQMQSEHELRGGIDEFRRSLQKPSSKPPTFFMTNSGTIDFRARVFQKGSDVATYIVTGERGRSRIAQDNPSYKNVLVFGADALDEQAMLEYLRAKMGIRHLLHEGGREAVSSLVARGLLHELFLTQMAHSPKGELDASNVQYLFAAENHTIPKDAKVVTARQDETGKARLWNFDFRSVRKM